MRDRVLSESGRREGPRASIASGGGRGRPMRRSAPPVHITISNFPTQVGLVRADFPELAR